MQNQTKSISILKCLLFPVFRILWSKERLQRKSIEKVGREKKCNLISVSSFFWQSFGDQKKNSKHLKFTEYLNHFCRAFSKFCNFSADHSSDKYCFDYLILKAKEYRTASVSAPSSISTPSRIVRTPYTWIIRPYKLFECVWVGHFRNRFGQKDHERKDH